MCLSINSQGTKIKYRKIRSFSHCRVNKMNIPEKFLKKYEKIFWTNRRVCLSSFYSQISYSFNKLLKSWNGSGVFLVIFGIFFLNSALNKLSVDPIHKKLYTLDGGLSKHLSLPRWLPRLFIVCAKFFLVKNTSRVNIKRSSRLFRQFLRLIWFIGGELY